MTFPEQENNVIAILEQSRRQEREVMERWMVANLADLKKERRGKNAFRLFIALYLIFILALNQGSDWISRVGDAEKKHTAVVHVEGIVSSDGQANAEDVMQGLQDAFEDEQTAGVIVVINTPGGSPVQSGMIYDEMRRQAKEHPDIPIYAVIEDLGASGGYYIASAAKAIYADKASMVGSIGVIFQGFGVKQAMEKLGLESRTLTAGNNKALLNPFETIKEEEKQHLQAVLNNIHLQFIKAVKEGRGNRLRGEDRDLFEGLIWTGEEALAKGLIDGLASKQEVARRVIGAEKIEDYTPQKDWIERFATTQLRLFWSQMF